MIMFCFFFFKQKTAYEVRISDWSSDVCSSDLTARAFALDADLCLAFARSKPQFGTGKKPVDDHIAADDAVIDQLGGSGVAHDEQRRHVGALHAFSKFDEDLPAIIEHTHRPPVRSEEHTSELQSLMRTPY